MNSNASPVDNPSSPVSLEEENNKLKAEIRLLEIELQFKKDKLQNSKAKRKSLEKFIKEQVGLLSEKSEEPAAKKAKRTL